MVTPSHNSQVGLPSWLSGLVGKELAHRQMQWSIWSTDGTGLEEKRGIAIVTAFI